MVGIITIKPPDVAAVMRSKASRCVATLEAVEVALFGLCGIHTHGVDLMATFYPRSVKDVNDLIE